MQTFAATMTLQVSLDMLFDCLLAGSLETAIARLHDLGLDLSANTLSWQPLSGDSQAGTLGLGSCVLDGFACTVSLQLNRETNHPPFLSSCQISLPELPPHRANAALERLLEPEFSLLSQESSGNRIYQRGLREQAVWVTAKEGTPNSLWLRLVQARHSPFG